MAKTILFSVHRNPQKDKDGNITYQVRHENWHTIDTKQLIGHLQLHNNLIARMVEPVLGMLKEEIVEQLVDNYRLHLNGIGTFFLKIGFRERSDDEGNQQRPMFTDASKITGNDVEVQGIGFTPDHELLDTLAARGYSFENVQNKGKVGKSSAFTTDDIKLKLNAYLDEHGYITRSKFCTEFGLTRYMASKHIAAILQDESLRIVETKESGIYMYKRI